MLSKEQILSSRKLRIEKVPAPAWAPDGTAPEDAFVYVRMMKGTERDIYEQSTYHQREKSKDKIVSNFRASLLARVICDEEGKLLFEPKDIVALGDLDAATLDAVYDAAAKLNGISKADEKELEKNCESSPD